MARDLNDTLMFVKVVEHGSFVSRRVRWAPRRTSAARCGSSRSACACSSCGRVQSPKVRAFVDFLVEHLTLDADNPGPGQVVKPHQP